MSSALDFSDIRPIKQSSNNFLDFSDIKRKNHKVSISPPAVLDFSDKPTKVSKPAEDTSHHTFVFNYEYVRTKLDVDYKFYHDIMVPFLKKISLHDSIDYDLTEYGVLIQRDITTLSITEVNTGDVLTDSVLKKLDNIVDMATRKGLFSFIDRTKEIRQELVNLNTDSINTLSSLNANLSAMRALHDSIISDRNSLLVYIEFGDFLVDEFKYDRKERYIPLIESRINSLRSTEMVINNRILLLDIQINVLLRNLELLQDVYYNLIPNMLIEQTSERISSLSNVIEKLKESIASKKQRN